MEKAYSALMTKKAVLWRNYGQTYLDSVHVRTDRPVLPPGWHPHQHSRKAQQEARSPAPHRLRALPRCQVPREATQRDHRQVPP
jgi:hypothetical protein